jgi:hypothetical protein
MEDFMITIAMTVVMGFTTLFSNLCGNDQTQQPTLPISENQQIQSVFVGNQDNAQKSQEQSQLLSSSAVSNANNTTKCLTKAQKAKIQELKNRFDNMYVQSKAMQQASAGSSYEMYHLSAKMGGLVAMYEATGDEKYVQYLLELSEAYVKSGKDRDRDGYLDWTCDNNSDFNHTHYEWRGARGIAQTIQLVKTNPKLSKYSSRADQLTRFIDKHVWEKWSNGVKRSLGASSNGKIDVQREPHFIARLGTIAVHMYQATGDKKYLDFTQKQSQRLKEFLNQTSKGSTYAWTLAIGNSTVSDSSHAADVAEFMVDAYQQGIVFNKHDIQKAVNTVRSNWNKSMSKPLFKMNLDGSGGYNPASDGEYFTRGWAALAQYDTQLQQIYQSWLNAGGHKQAPTLNVQGYLAKAYAYN